MLLPLDGPAVYGDIDVSTTAVEAKVGGSPLEERAVLTVQPLDGHVYFGYDNSVTVATGTKIYKGQIYPFEASPDLQVYLITDSGTIDVRITEVS